MWTKIYDQWGQPIKFSSNEYKKILHRNHEPIAKIELLDTDFAPVGTAIWSNPKGRIENIVSDGNIDIDIDRGTRRTAELTLLNPSGEFTPTTKGMDPEGWWNGKVYLNRVVRIWRGVREGDLELYVPVGTFLIDTAEIIVEENMSMANLVMSDFWKKIHKSRWQYTKRYPKGTWYYKVIKDILAQSGIANRNITLDSLGGRADEDKKIQKPLKFKRGESMGEGLKKMARKWDLDVYFDPLGNFRAEDRTSDRDKQVVYRFMSTDTDDGQNGGLVSITRTFNDDDVYNNIVVIGTGNEKKVIRAQRSDENPRSKINISRIGRRTKYMETDDVSNQAQADRLLNRLWSKRFRVHETINAEVICNPMLEADDMIRFTETERAKVDGLYRLRRFNVPLVTSKQSVEAENILGKNDF